MFAIPGQLAFAPQGTQGRIKYGSDGTKFDIRCKNVQSPIASRVRDGILVHIPQKAPDSISMIASKLCIRFDLSIYVIDGQAEIWQYIMGKDDKTANSTTLYTWTEGIWLAVRMDSRTYDVSLPCIDGIHNYHLAAIHRGKRIFTRKLRFGELVNEPMHIDDDSPFIFFRSIHPCLLIVLDTSTTRTHTLNMRRGSQPFPALDISGISDGIIHVHTESNEIFSAKLPRKFQRTETWSMPTTAGGIDWRVAYDRVVIQMNNHHFNTETACIICLDAPVNAAIIACGHMCMCFECSLTVKQSGHDCPLCRQPIVDVLKIFKA